MTQYRRGASKEYAVMKALREDGYTVTRSAGSHGLWDVTAVNESEVRLIQVKYTKVKSKNGWYDDNCLAFEELNVPKGVTKEAWVYTYGNKTPVRWSDLGTLRLMRAVYTGQAA